MHVRIIFITTQQYRATPCPLSLLASDSSPVILSAVGRRRLGRGEDDDLGLVLVALEEAALVHHGAHPARRRVRRILVDHLRNEGKLSVFERFTY